MNQREQVEDKPQETKKLFLSSGEVARMLGCSTTWVNTLINKGEMDSYRIGGTGWHRIPVDSVKAFAKRNRVTLDWGIIQ